MALFVIYGTMNSGKTHTCWLIYNLLKTAGTEIDFDPKSLATKPTYSEVLQHIENSSKTGTQMLYPDFRALFDYRGKKIAIFSAGDFLSHRKWKLCSFKDNMLWAEKNKVDHVICCARSYNKKGSVHQFILTHYRMQIYRWYEKRWSNVLNERLADAQRIAVSVFTDIKKDF